MPVSTAHAIMMMIMMMMMMVIYISAEWVFHFQSRVPIPKANSHSLSWKWLQRLVSAIATVYVRIFRWVYLPWVLSIVGLWSSKIIIIKIIILCCVWEHKKCDMDYGISSYMSYLTRATVTSYGMREFSPEGTGIRLVKSTWMGMNVKQWRERDWKWKAIPAHL